MRPTITDIAERADVTNAAVSFLGAARLAGIELTDGADPGDRGEPALVLTPRASAAPPPR